MHRSRLGGRGLSEIVGALMLVLIVVAAATTLSVFVSEYQKQVQAEQAIQQERSLESLTVLRVTPTLDPNASAYTELNFTLASLYINPSVVTSVSVNDQRLMTYNAWELNVTTGSYEWVTVAAGGQLSLGPRDVVNILVNATPGPGSSFYDSNYTLPATDYVKVEVFTALLNDFSRVFIPPTAVGLVTLQETWNGTAYVPVPILDATESFQPGNATLVAWTWHITPDNETLTGEKAVASFNPSFSTHTIVLTVTNSEGLLSTDRFVYA